MKPTEELKRLRAKLAELTAINSPLWLDCWNAIVRLELFISNRKARIV